MLLVIRHHTDLSTYFLLFLQLKFKKEKERCGFVLNGLLVEAISEKGVLTGNIELCKDHFLRKVTELCKNHAVCLPNNEPYRQTIQTIKLFVII